MTQKLSELINVKYFDYWLTCKRKINTSYNASMEYTEIYACKHNL